MTTNTDPAARPSVATDGIVRTMLVDTDYRAERRTRFCTPRGWFAYRDLTPTMRRAILSVDGGHGAVGGWVTWRTIDALASMGLVERCGAGANLTHHGGVLWCELDA